ncbi:hypothetical protein OTU49_009106, partial [Cherax quadricarinatus]
NTHLEPVPLILWYKYLMILTFKSVTGLVYCCLITKASPYVLYVSDGAKYLCDLLNPLPKHEHDKWIEKVIEAVQKLPISSTLISKEDIHKAAQEVGTSENDDIENLLQIVDIYKVPKLIYNTERKKFVLAPARARDLHGDPSDKAGIFRDRYSIVYQRTCNHDLFRQPVVGNTDEDSKKFGLVKVEYLLGSSSRLEGVVALGLLTQLIEGQHHLEDDTGAVHLDLTNAKFHPGLFTHNCFILVEGWYEDGMLHASAIGLPPPEASSSTRLQKSCGHFLLVMLSSRQWLSSSVVISYQSAMELSRHLSYVKH